MTLNQNELVKFLKKKRRFLSAKQIAKETKETQQGTNRKLNKLAPRIVEKKIRKVDYGDQKRHVAFYRYKVKKR